MLAVLIAVLILTTRIERNLSIIRQLLRGRARGKYIVVHSIIFRTKRNWSMSKAHP